MAALSKASIEGYAEYEQLVGGVNKLFGDSSKLLMGYAQDAYRTSGLSANKYMQQATSFSAALITSLGGDTAKAAEYADKAIRAMSDNANTFGTEMGLLQNAFQGFAKQNYTMLDNLKLGYGGTQEEMKRLIKDAEAIQKRGGKMVDYSIDSFADIVEAIEVIQTEMEITGTTVGEAERTISGSIYMMKSAWENLVVGFADGEQDIGQLLDNFVYSVGKVSDNIVPRIKEMLPRLVEAIGELIDRLGPIVSELVNDLLPFLITGAANLVADLIARLPGILADFGVAFKEAIIQSLNDAGYTDIADTLTKVFDIAGQTVNAFISYMGNIVQAIPPWEEIKSTIDSVTSTIQKLIPWIEFAAITFVSLKAGLIIQKIATAFGEAQVAIKLLTMSTNAQNLAQFALNGTMTIFETIVALLTGKLTLAQLATAALAKGQALLNAVMMANPITLWIVGIMAAVAAIVLLWENCEGFRNAVIAIGEFLVSFFTETIPQAVSDLVESFQSFLSQLWGIMTSAVEVAVNTVTSIAEWFSTLPSRISEAFTNLKESASQLWNDMTTVLGEKWSSFMSTINTAWSDFVSTITTSELWTSFTQSMSDLYDTAKEIWDNVVSTVQNAVQKLKDAMNFEWSLPHIKLPHFSIIGSFSLNPPRVPTFSVAWYRKAMNNAMILNGATIFGAMGGKLLGGGEAGKEVVSGADTLMRMIKDAVREVTSEPVAVSSRNTSGIQIIQNIQTVPQTPVELAAATRSYFEQARWAI